MLESVLTELALLFALCVGAGVLFVRLRLPPIVGFLAIGALIGPHAIGLVRHEATVQQLAEVGVVVLLFAVGMEVPLRQLARLRRTILLGGGVQIALTVVAVAVTCWLFGMAWNSALFVGFLLSLSSTAAITKLLVDHGEFASPHGRVGIGIAIAQDLAVVPMILLIPLLAGGRAGGLLQTLENIAILLAVLVAIHWALPRVLDLVSRTRSRELFVLTLATLCLWMAVVTSHLGLSMALGSFLAGIMVAESDYSGHAAAEVEPFRDALASLFFVSIGMMFDLGTIRQWPGLVGAALLAVIVVKALIAGFAVRALGQPQWVRLRAGLLLAQVGEFSFVLAQVANGGAPANAAGEAALMPPRTLQIFVVVAVLSIAATPLLHAFGGWAVARFRHRERDARGDADGRLTEHAIVVGYGPTGRAAMAGLRALGLPAVAVEMNASTVRSERAAGVDIHFGDATRTTVLKSLGIERARILVLAINDVEAARRIAQVARHLAPGLHVLARVLYNPEVAPLRAAGANEVVPQELEASVEVLVRALRRFLVADDEIGRQVGLARRAAGGLEKSADVERLEIGRIAEFVPGLGVGIHCVGRGAAVDGRTLAEAGVRRTTGCSVVAVRRGRENLPAVTPDTRLAAGDTVVVIGPADRLPDAAAMFHAPVGGKEPAAEPVASAASRPEEPET